MFDETISALLATDFLAFLHKALETIEPNVKFVPSWHLQHMNHHLTKVTNGSERRLIFNLPPRSLKTVTVSVAYAAFRLGHNPGLEIIVVSATSELARKHAANFRRLISAAWFREVFPRFQLARDGNRTHEQKTTLNGYRFATSSGAGITGQGADLIIIDDPNKAQEIFSEAKRAATNHYYDATLYTRLTDKRLGAVILVQQRLHEDDMSGHLASRSTWTTVAIPALAMEDETFALSGRPGHVYTRPAGDILQPDRNSLEAIDEARSVLGSLNFEAQYQQNPTPHDGQIIKRAWIKTYDDLPSNFDFKLISWDTASTLNEDSDYSVGTVWGRVGRSFYLIDVIRGRYEPADLWRLIERSHFDYKVHATLIEKTELGEALRSEMIRNSSIRPIPINPRFDKRSRLEVQAVKFESGQVWFPRQAIWLAECMNELLGFPARKHDDQVDSITQALKYFTRHMEAVASVSHRGNNLPIKRPRSRIGQ